MLLSYSPSVQRALMKQKKTGLLTRQVTFRVSGWVGSGQSELDWIREIGKPPDSIPPDP